MVLEGALGQKLSPAHIVNIQTFNFVKKKLSDSCRYLTIINYSVRDIERIIKLQNCLIYVVKKMLLFKIYCFNVRFCPFFCLVFKLDYSLTFLEFFVTSFSNLTSLCIVRNCQKRQGQILRARIFKLLRNTRIDSKEPIPPGCVAWQAGTTTLFLLGS